MARIKRLASKGYRDAYLASRVRATIALQVRTLRRSLRLSQQKFARMIDTTQSAVSDLENPDGEQVSVQTLLNIAAALNVALIVRFASFTDFLKLMSDMSPEALSVLTIQETIAHAKRGQPAAATTQAIFPPISTAEVNRGDVSWITRPLLSGQAHLSGPVQTSTEKSMQTYAKVGLEPLTSP